MNNQSMPKEYLIEYRCKAVDCRVSVVNADKLTSEEIQTLADREIRRQIALTPVFDVKEHMQPSERETAAKRNQENARLADLMRRFATGQMSKEEILAEMNNQ
ncbi:MAG: hypothetical protein ACYTBW_00010 [Planctomycetota bacterium]|jgi:hypothetical protein